MLSRYRGLTCERFQVRNSLAYSRNREKEGQEELRENVLMDLMGVWD